jgi:hypothetical protein
LHTGHLVLYQTMSLERIDGPLQRAGLSDVLG